MPQTYILDTTYYNTINYYMRVRVKMEFVDWLDGIHSAILTIHDNLCDFKIGRPPYLPDLKEGAYLFWG